MPSTTNNNPNGSGDLEIPSDNVRNDNKEKDRGSQDNTSSSDNSDGTKEDKGRLHGKDEISRKDQRISFSDVRFEETEADEYLFADGVAVTENEVTHEELEQIVHLLPNQRILWRHGKENKPGIFEMLFGLDRGDIPLGVVDSARVDGKKLRAKFHLFTGHEYFERFKGFVRKFKGPMLSIGYSRLVLENGNIMAVPFELSLTPFPVSQQSNVREMENEETVKVIEGLTADIAKLEQKNDGLSADKKVLEDKATGLEIKIAEHIEKEKSLFKDKADLQQKIDFLEKGKPMIDEACAIKGEDKREHFTKLFEKLGGELFGAELQIFKDESAGAIRTSPGLPNPKDPSKVTDFMKSNPSMLAEATQLAKEAGMTVEDFLAGD